MNSAWQTLPERGSPALIRFIAWLSLRSDRRVGRALLYPICLYFLLSAPVARAASRRYLERVLARPPHFGQVFMHFLTFARIILDRVFFVAGRLSLFRIAISGQEVIESRC